MPLYEVFVVALVEGKNEEEAKQKAVVEKSLLYKARVLQQIPEPWEQEAEQHPLYPSPEKSLW